MVFDSLPNIDGQYIYIYMYIYIYGISPTTNVDINHQY